MDENRSDSIPDWLKPLYEQERSADSQQGENHSQPDWLQYAQSSTSQVGSAQAPAARSAFSIENYVLEGTPSPALSRYLGTQRLLQDNMHLNASYKIIAQAEKQIREFVDQTSSLLIPEEIEVYRLLEVSDMLKQYPVQLATLIADTILIVSGELETCSKQTRQAAIMGIAQRIVKQKLQGNPIQTASETVTAEILSEIENAGSATASLAVKIQIYARKFFLKAVSEETPMLGPRTGKKGSSWI